MMMLYHKVKKLFRRAAVAAAFSSVVVGYGVTAFAASGRPDVLCIYYPEWHVYPEGEQIFGKGRTEWDLVNSARPRFPGHKQPIRLLDGCPDDSKPSDVAKEIDYAADAGIDCFVYDWYWANHKPIEHEALEEGFLKAANRNRIKFALMWAYHHRTDAFRPKPGEDDKRFFWKLSFTPEEFHEAISYCIEKYFRQPNYYKLNGKLFFSIYNATWFIQNNGGEEGARRLLAWAQEAVGKAGLPPIHFSGMVWNPGSVGKIRAVGFESSSTYSMSPPGTGVVPYETIITQGREYNASFLDAPLPHIPLALRGWDTTPRCRQDEPFPWAKVRYPYTAVYGNGRPEHFAQCLKDARRQAETAPKKPGAILINAWNEYTEGSYLMPDTVSGDAYLRAIRSVFGR